VASAVEAPRANSAKARRRAMTRATGSAQPTGVESAPRAERPERVERRHRLRGQRPERRQALREIVEVDRRVLEAQPSEPPDRRLLVSLRVAAMDYQADSQCVREIDAGQLERRGSHEQQVPGRQRALESCVRTPLAGHEHTFACRSRRPLARCPSCGRPAPGVGCASTHKWGPRLVVQPGPRGTEVTRLRRDRHATHPGGVPASPERLPSAPPTQRS